MMSSQEEKEYSLQLLGVPVERSLLAYLGEPLGERSLGHLHQPVEGDLLAIGLRKNDAVKSHEVAAATTDVLCQLRSCEPTDGTDRRVRCLGNHRPGSRCDCLFRLVLPRQLHEEGLVQEVARERMAQPHQRAGGEQGPMGEAPGSDTASQGSAMEEGKGALQDRRPAQEGQRSGRRAGRGREEGGRW